MSFAKVGKETSSTQKYAVDYFFRILSENSNAAADDNFSTQLPAPHLDHGARCVRLPIAGRRVDHDISISPHTPACTGSRALALARPLVVLLLDLQ